MEIISHEDALWRMEETIRLAFKDPHLFKRPRGDSPGGFTWVVYEDISAIGTAAQAVGFVTGVARLTDIQARVGNPLLYNEEKLAQSLFSIPDTNGMAEELEHTNYADRTAELVRALMDKKFEYDMTLREALSAVTQSIREIVMDAAPDGEEYQQYVEVFG